MRCVGRGPPTRYALRVWGPLTAAALSYLKSHHARKYSTSKARTASERLKDTKTVRNQVGEDTEQTVNRLQRTSNEIREPIGSTNVLSPTAFVTRLPPVVGNRLVEIDHLPTEITLGAVPHLPRLSIEILHFDIELVECSR